MLVVGERAIGAAGAVAVAPNVDGSDVDGPGRYGLCDRAVGDLGCVGRAARVVGDRLDARAVAIEARGDGLQAVHRVGAVVVEAQFTERSIGRGRGDELRQDGAVGAVAGRRDGGDAGCDGRRGAHEAVEAVVGEGDGCGAAGAAVGAGERHDAVDAAAVVEAGDVLRRDQIERRDAGLSEGEDAGGTVGVGDSDAEFAVARVSCVEAAVAVAVEDVAQRFKIGFRRRIPGGEFEAEAVKARGRGGAVELQREHAGAGASPGRAPLDVVGARGGIAEVMRCIKFRDADVRARRKGEEDGVFDVIVKNLGQSRIGNLRFPLV